MPLRDVFLKKRNSEISGDMQNCIVLYIAKRVLLLTRLYEVQH